MFGPSLVTRSPVTGFARQLLSHLFGQPTAFPHPPAPNQRAAGFAAQPTLQPLVPTPLPIPPYPASWATPPAFPPAPVLHAPAGYIPGHPAPTPAPSRSGEDLFYRVMAVHSSAGATSVLTSHQRQQIDCLLADRSKIFLSQSDALLSSSNYFTWEPALCNVLEVVRMHAHLEDGLMTPSDPLDVEVCCLLENHAINLVCARILRPIVRKLDPLSRFSSLRSLWDAIAALLLDVGIIRQVAMFRRAMNHSFREGLQNNVILDTILEQTKLAVSGGALTVLPFVSPCLPLTNTVPVFVRNSKLGNLSLANAFAPRSSTSINVRKINRPALLELVMWLQIPLRTTRRLSHPFLPLTLPPLSPLPTSHPINVSMVSASNNAGSALVGEEEVLDLGVEEEVMEEVVCAAAMGPLPLVGEGSLLVPKRTWPGERMMDGLRRSMMWMECGITELWIWEAEM